MRAISFIVASTLMLLSGTAMAATPGPAQLVAPPAAGASASAPQGSPADQQRLAAIRQYQHDLVSVVALRDDPAYLLGAAILAKPFTHQTPGLDFDALSQRAAAAPDGQAAAAWARLDMCKEHAPCPNPVAFAYLKRHAADNAVVWLVALDLAAANKDTAAERAALGKAAAAQVYDDYYGAALAGVTRAVSVLPPLADTTAGARAGQPDSGEGVRMLVAINAVQAHPRPELGPLLELCTTDAVAGHPDQRMACLKLAHTLAWGSSPVARAVGLRIQGELDATKQDRDAEASRDLAWQVHQYSGLLQRALTDSTLASQWLAIARNGGTELSLIFATLRANHVPLDAPADAGTPASAGTAGQ